MSNVLKRTMLCYPPGKLYMRGEDRCQANIEASTASAMRACNDLGYAAAVLLQKGYEVYLKDYQTEGLSEEVLLNDLEKENIGLFVMSTTNTTVFDDIALVNRIRQKFDCKVILKGAVFYAAERQMLDMLDFSNVDFLIGGEIDFAIGKLADYVFKSEGKLMDIDNIFYKNSDGKMVPTRFHVWEKDLDSVPFPARQLMNNNLYVRPDTGEAMATIQTARGCPSSCIYCLSPEISGKAVRFRSPQNVYDELLECYEKFNIKNFFFKADTFTINEKWVTQLCNLIIASPLYKKIHFTANSRVRPLKYETLKLMKKAGCFMVAFGFESGSQATLDKIKKGATVEENLQAAKWCRKARLPFYGFFMIGFPWETKEEVNITIKHIFEVNPSFMEISIVLPYYGTALYEECKKTNVLAKSPLGSDFFHSNTTGTATVPMSELMDMRKKAMLRFYLRPTYVVKKIAHALIKPVVLKNYVKYGIRLLKNLARKS